MWTDNFQPRALATTARKWLGPRVAWVARHAYWWLPTVLTFVVLYYHAWRPVLGWDEAATWEASRRSVKELFLLAGHIDAVLLPYYLFMHYWIAVFGDSEVILRAPSILAMTAAVGVSAVLARRLFSPRIGFLTGVLLAVMPSVTRYGQEARPYGFALLLGTATTLILLWVLVAPSWRRWLVYSVGVALLGLFQLMGLLLLLGHAAALAHRLWGEKRSQPPIPSAGIDRRPYICWVLAAAGGVAPSMPLVVLGLTQHEKQLSWLPPMKWEFFADFPKELFCSVAIGWFLIGVAFLARHHHRAALGWLTAIAIVPTTVLYLIAFVTPMWLPRYVIYTLVAWCILAAVAVAGSWWRTTVLLALVVALAIPIHDTLRTPTGAEAKKRLPNHRAATNVIAGNYRPGDGMVFEPNSAWSLRPAVRYYLAESKRPKDVLAVRTPLQTHSFYAKECRPVRRCLQGVNRVWVYHAGIHNSPLDYFPGPIPDALHQDYYLANQWYVDSGTIGIYIRKGVPKA